VEKNQIDLTRLVATSVDSSSRISFREILAKLFFRFKIFLLCTLTVPLIALYLVHLVPYNYKSTAKLLIRYDTKGLPYFAELATSKRQIISGQSDAEIIRSLPVTMSVVKELSLKDSDIAKPAYKILFSHFAKPFYRFLKNDNSSNSQDEKTRIEHLAKELKESIDSKVVQKWRPEIEISDEVIEVEVKSPDRNKVRQIANKLCDGFINEYYRLCEAEAEQAYNYLTRQMLKLEEELRKAQVRDDISVDAAGKGLITENPPGLDWSDRNINTNPVVDTTAKQVTTLELELERVKHIYKPGSPELVRVEKELQEARQRLKRHKSLESASALLNIFKDKRHKAYMTMQIFKNRLIPISVVERAVTPRKSRLVFIVRYVLVGVIGLVLGSVIGFSLVMFLSAMDHRLCRPWDVEKEASCPVIGSIPIIRRNEVDLANIDQLPLEEASPTVMQTLGRLDLVNKGKGQLVVVTGVSRYEGKTFLTLQLACALADDKRTKVLLIDGNFQNPSLGTLLGHRTDRGLVDALKQNVPVKDVIFPTSIKNLEIIPAGYTKERQSLGFYKKSLKELIMSVRDEYDGIFLDTAGVLTSTDPALFASEADQLIMVLRSETTRREPYVKALDVLAQVGVACFGVILNFRRYRIPKIFYGD